MEETITMRFFWGGILLIFVLLSGIEICWIIQLKRGLSVLIINQIWNSGRFHQKEPVLPKISNSFHRLILNNNYLINSYVWIGGTIKDHRKSIWDTGFFPNFDACPDDRFGPLTVSPLFATRTNIQSTFPLVAIVCCRDEDGDRANSIQSNGRRKSIVQ